MNAEITYEPYNKHSFVVRGDRNKYGGIIIKLKGKWNPRLKGGPGWNVPIQKEKELKELVDSVNNATFLDNMEKNAKPRHAQKKYHRATSDTESSIDAAATEANVKDAIEYYKTFSKSPGFDTPSSSHPNTDEESEDNFPEPRIKQSASSNSSSHSHHRVSERDYSSSRSHKKYPQHYSRDDKRKKRDKRDSRDEKRDKRDSRDEKREKRDSRDEKREKRDSRDEKREKREKRDSRNDKREKRDSRKEKPKKYYSESSSSDSEEERRLIRKLNKIKDKLAARKRRS